MARDPSHKGFACYAAKRPLSNDAAAPIWVWDGHWWPGIVADARSEKIRGGADVVASSAK